MKIKLDCDIAKELLTILSYMDIEFINKIPKDFMKELVNLAANSEKDFYIEKGKKLKEQNLSIECKQWITYLYNKYCDKKILHI